MTALPMAAVYAYPTFVMGTVNFKNNNAGVSVLNYNKLLDEMQFINSKGDTLSLGDEETINSVAIYGDTYYYHQGYIKKMDDIKGVKFASKNILGLSNRQKIGGMGELSSASIDTYEKISSSQGARDMVLKENLTFAEYSNFFIGDTYNHFKPLNKKNLLNMYGKQPAVEKYLSENPVSFFRENDVKKLIEFLKTL